MKDKFKVSLFLQRFIPLVILVNLVLVLLGVLLYPTVMKEGGLLGICADTTILLTYGYLALFSPISAKIFPPGLLKLSGLLGLISGIVLAFDLSSAYIIEQDGTTSSISSLVAYGFFLLLVLISGFFAARSTGKFRSGPAGAVWCVIMALLVWFFIEFTFFYIFSKTPNGAKFIELEMQTDFQRSKATDFPGFVMSDFYGAGFYHLLLGLFFAGFLGSIGGLVGKLFHRK